jgi:hypothetical protein
LRPKLTAGDLRALGFQEIACWTAGGTGIALQIDEGRKTQLTVANALYAFCRDEEVLYIGKTARTLKERLAGYCKPGASQRTNRRCNEAIGKALEKGEAIAVLAFIPVAHLRFLEFEINLAAGLEDALIRRFDPPWNGGGKGGAIAESAAIEAEQEGSGDTAPATPEIGSFEVHLGPTYYEKGVVNPGTAASALLGEDGQMLVVKFSDGSPSVATRIDRRANATGAVRFVGGNGAIADWFQAHFQLGETVAARILGPCEVEFIVPADRSVQG